MRKCLVIIDMVNGFVKGGPLADIRINKITNNIIDLIHSALTNNVDIIAFRDCHTKNDKEFEIYPEHCLKGSWESELIEELQPYQNYFKIIDKDTTNGYATKEFQQLISQPYDKVVVCGCCTDICVKDFVVSYLDDIKRKNLKTNISVIADAVGTFDNVIHYADVENEIALSEMEMMGANISYMGEKSKKHIRVNEVDYER